MATLTKARARAALQRGAFLVATYGATTSYGIDGAAVSSRLARELTAGADEARPTQSDLFLTANEDGLFPGYSQTWRAR